MLKFVFIIAFMVCCHAAPFANNQQGDSSSDASQTSSLLNRPTPINPNIPSDPKPDEKITLIQDDEIPKVKRDNEQDKKVSQSSTHLGPINLKDQQEREKPKQVKREFTHIEMEEKDTEDFNKNSDVQQHNPKVTEMPCSPEDMKRKNEQQTGKQNKRDLSDGAVPYKPKTDDLSKNTNNKGSSEQQTDVKTHHKRDTTATPIPTTGTMQNNSHSSETHHQHNKRESTGEQPPEDHQMKNNSSTSNQNEQENPQKRGKRQEDRKPHSDIIRYQICTGRKVRRSLQERNSEQIATNGKPTTAITDIGNQPILKADASTIENENKKPFIPADQVKKQKRDYQDCLEEYAYAHYPISSRGASSTQEKRTTAELGIRNKRDIPIPIKPESCKTKEAKQELEKETS